MGVFALAAGGGEELAGWLPPLTERDEIAEVLIKNSTTASRRAV
jgi:hypothetical protein